MDISVVIVTRNRARYLAGALLALSQNDSADINFEIIVADNGSSDSTPDICETYQKLFPNFRSFYDGRPGQIVGWHQSLALAQGEVICFIDDDTRPSPGWLNGVKDVFSDPNVGLATGKITPEFETEAPEWRKDMILQHDGGIWSAQWGLLDFGSEVRDIEAAFVWGRNFLVRRSVMVEAGGFHPGGMPAHLFHFTGDGDMGAGEAVERLGLKVRYHPGAMVTNVFQKHQNDEAEICRWIYGEGLVTSHILMRELSARNPDTPAAELDGHVSSAISEHQLDTIGHGYLSSFTDLPDNLIEIFKTEGRRGFDNHQKYFKNDSLFRDWVLRPHYLDIDACYNHPDLVPGKEW